jgi:hypothetical protein
MDDRLREFLVNPHSFSSFTKVGAKGIGSEFYNLRKKMDYTLFHLFPSRALRQVCQRLVIQIKFGYKFSVTFERTLSPLY